MIFNATWLENFVFCQTLFKKKSKIDLLKEKYNKLQEEAYRLSTVNRTQSDQKYAEAQEVLKEIETLEQSNK